MQGRAAVSVPPCPGPRGPADAGRWGGAMAKRVRSAALKSSHKRDGDRSSNLRVGGMEKEPPDPQALHAALVAALEAVGPTGRCRHHTFRLLKRVCDLAMCTRPMPFLVERDGRYVANFRPAPPDEQHLAELADICQAIFDLLITSSTVIEYENPPHIAIAAPDEYPDVWQASDRWLGQLRHERDRLAKWLERFGPTPGEAIRSIPALVEAGALDSVAAADRAGAIIMAAINAGRIIGDAELTGDIRRAHGPEGALDQNRGENGYAPDAHAFILCAAHLLRDRKHPVNVGTFKDDWRIYFGRGCPLIADALEQADRVQKKPLTLPAVAADTSDITSLTDWVVRFARLNLDLFRSVGIDLDERQYSPEALSERDAQCKPAAADLMTPDDFAYITRRLPYMIGDLLSLSASLPAAVRLDERTALKILYLHFILFDFEAEETGLPLTNWCPPNNTSDLDSRDWHELCLSRDHAYGAERPEWIELVKRAVYRLSAGGSAALRSNDEVGARGSDGKAGQPTPGAGGGASVDPTGHASVYPEIGFFTLRQIGDVLTCNGKQEDIRRTLGDRGELKSAGNGRWIIVDKGLPGNIRDDLTHAATQSGRKKRRDKSANSGQAGLAGVN